MAIGYRSILRLSDDQDSVKIAEDQMRSWLRTKFRSSQGTRHHLDWEGSGVYPLSAEASVTVVCLRDPRDQSVRQLIRFDETNPTGRWIVSAWAFSLPLSRSNKQTLVIDVDRDGVGVDDALRDAKPPRLVQHVLDSTAAHDGTTTLTTAPMIVREHDVSAVLAAITDPGRLVSVVVAVTPGEVSDERWRDVVGQLTRDSVGVSATFAVAESAIEGLEALLPPSHQIPRGGVRTFAPQVDLSEPGDGIRHRILGAATLARSIRGGRVGGSLPTVHAQRARRRLVEAELPSDARRAMEMIVREESAVIRAARVSQMASSVTDAPSAPVASGSNPPRTAGDWFRSGLTKLLKWVNHTEPTPESVDELDRFIASTANGYTVATQQIDSLLDSQSNLQMELEQLREQVDIAQLEAGLEEEASREWAREARILRQRLKEANKFEALFVESEPDDLRPPQDFEELILRISPGSVDNPVAARVEFCGDESATLEIDKRDTVGRYVARMWEYILVLHDFAEARENGFEGSVHQYLTDTNSNGRKCSPQRHAAGESDSVTSNAKMLKERMFPVPPAVDSSCRTTMLAHFKPTHADTYAPRLYYLDDTARSGKIYVGYIGRHLANTRTN